MFTSGRTEGESIGVFCDEPLYHASLGPAECEHLLTTNGFVVMAYAAQDPQCGGHTVWLATREPAALPAHPDPLSPPSRAVLTLHYTHR